MKEKNTKLIKDKEKYKNNIELFASENSEANKHIKKLNQIIAIKNKEKKESNNQEQEEYIKSLENKLAEFNEIIQNSKDNMMKMEIKNKMNLENKSKYEEQLVKYQQLLDNEKNKVKNAETIISRLNSELDYVKEKNLIENKVIKEEIINLKKKITELNEKLNNVDNSDSEDIIGNNQQNNNYNEDIKPNNLNYRKKIIVNKKGNLNQNKPKNNLGIEQEDKINLKNNNNIVDIK